MFPISFSCERERQEDKRDEEFTCLPTLFLSSSGSLACSLSLSRSIFLSLSLSLSLALSPSRSLPLSLSLSLSLFLSFFWAACLVEVEDEDKGELQQKRFAEAEREWDRARHREKHRLWDREGRLASPFSSSCQCSFLWKERRKEKREEEFTCSSYLVLAPPSSLPPEPVSVALYLLFFLGMKRSIDSIDRGRERASWLAHLFLRLDKNIIWREGGLTPSSHHAPHSSLFPAPLSRSFFLSFSGHEGKVFPTPTPTHHSLALSLSLSLSLSLFLSHSLSLSFFSLLSGMSRRTRRGGEWEEWKEEL